MMMVEVRLFVDNMQDELNKCKGCVDDATLVFESHGRPSIPPVLVTGTDERLKRKKMF